MINQVKALIDYKGQLMEAWLEVVDDSDKNILYFHFDLFACSNLIVRAYI